TFAGVGSCWKTASRGVSRGVPEVRIEARLSTRMSGSVFICRMPVLPGREADPEEARQSGMARQIARPTGVGATTPGRTHRHPTCGGGPRLRVSTEPTTTDLEWTELVQRAVDTARVLAADAVQKVGNGHPGTAMSLAPAASTLFQKVMRHGPADANWVGRERFVLSAGHSSLTL